MQPNPGAPDRIAVYSRIATQDRHDLGGEGTSVNAALRCAVNEGLTVVDTYLDVADAASIPLPERPEGRRLLADAHVGRFGRVLVTSLDDLERDTTGVISTQSALAAAGCRLAIVDKGRAFDVRVTEHSRRMTVIAEWPINPTAEEQDRVVELLVRLLERAPQTQGMPARTNDEQGA
jgi:DNA invertase Pin-like site-specific DNA recombinase